MKRWAIVIGIALVLAIMAAGKWMLTAHVEDALRGAGWTWDSREESGLLLTWHTLERPGMTAEKVEADLKWPPTVVVHEPRIDLQTRMPGDAPTQTSTPTTPDVPATVIVRNLAFTWGDQEMLGGMSGEILPELHLSGPAGHIAVETRPNGARVMAGTANFELDLPHLTGTATIEASTADLWMFRVTMPDAQLIHPLLGEEPLPPNAIMAEIAWIPETQAVAIDGTIGKVPIQVSGTIIPDPAQVDLKLRVPLTPLADVVALFGERVPEAKGADMTGTLGLAATLSRPPLTWTVIPDAEGLGAANVLPENFGGHTVQWRSVDDEGLPLVRQTGPTTAGWVPIADAGWLAPAATAAEDIRFDHHPGYDIKAIREVLEKAPQEERPRGGSTITQQLAKNLFLDGRRTLTRKLRELLLALDMERRASKDAILALYLNVVEFGPGIHGIGAACDAWFLKEPSRLTPREAAFLAAILPAPRMWHEKIVAGGAVPRWQVDEILSRMGRRGDLTAAQVTAAKQEKLRIVPPPAP